MTFTDKSVFLRENGANPSKSLFLLASVIQTSSEEPGFPASKTALHLFQAAAKINKLKKIR